LFSRDVNNYLAFKEPDAKHPKGEVKTKGAYAEPGLQKNPTNIICVDAVKAYILDGVPVETTIRQCNDIRKFITVRAVKGGGEWVANTIVAETVGAKRAALTAAGWSFIKDVGWHGPNHEFALTHDVAIKIVRDAIPRQYLGKAVRWYYGRGQRGHIAYATNGNLVARSEGARPVMELPDVLPCDIDYDWYVAETQSLLKDINCC
jgi:hypothetical protein